MPMYEYFCESCDYVFTDLRSMAEYHEPSQCPVCGTASPRTVASAPRLNCMRADQRKAHQTNERSAHAPRMSGHGHSCGSGCQHHHHKAATTETTTDKPSLKNQPGKRPWMLGH